MKEYIRLVKFVLVGALGVAINTSILYALTEYLHIFYLLSSLIAIEISILSNFVWNNLWTFKTEKIKGFVNIVKKFLTFNGTSLGALLIQTIAGNIGDKLFGIDKRQLLLPFIIVILVLPYNYFMYNAVIWRTWKLPIIGKLFSKTK